MSGHSKWSQIKHKKGITDKKKGQLFSKLSKLISLAARKGANLQSNLELKSAIDNAKSYNMPNDNIERAIKKVSDKSAAQLEELFIEAIGPGGIALKIKAITDSRNRTIAEIKNILSDNSSKMVPPGSISWMFSQPAIITDEATQDQITRLFESLDNNDDVEDIISNLEQI
ncbi:MAG: YebC/PmpR family DNA-binding transcriptional regulator [Candidatus Yanofskybacteria bacterium]|nr:YebC/PmpR family DNA-binding transcriptional regulator [Candidatus Yanofskybacteria bacterium]